MHNVSHDDLVRYLDGELDAEEARAVERALAVDASLRNTLRSLSEGTALLRAAFNEPVHGAVPQALAERVSASLAKARGGGAPSWTSRRLAPRRWYIPAVVAASIAVIALGLGGGYLVSDARLAGERARFEALLQEDRQAFELAVQDALERQTSGTSVNWHNPESGNGGTVTPIRTFKSSNGEWCREYEHEAKTASDAERRHAIACRTQQGRWETRVPVFVTS
jgi:surface antigen